MCSVVLQLTRDKKDGRGSSLGRGTESTIPWRGDGGTEAARKQRKRRESRGSGEEVGESGDRREGGVGETAGSRRGPGAVRAPRAGCAGRRLAGGHGGFEDAGGLDLVCGRMVMAGWWREEKLVHGVSTGRRRGGALLLSSFPLVCSLDPVSLHRVGLEMAARNGGAGIGGGQRSSMPERS